MTGIDRLLDNAHTYAERFDKADLPMPPGLGVAVVACMDARVNVYAILGLTEGDAHVIRNAGGVVTEDTIRSLTISQRLLATREIMLIHHADCGMRTFSDQEFQAQIEADTGVKPAWSPEAFRDSADDIRQSINRLKASPFLPYRDAIRGFVYDEETGSLQEVP